ncbi:MAG: type VI secretion system contractile sheath large subunit, partial [Phycisphaerae bacterium]
MTEHTEPPDLEVNIPMPRGLRVTTEGQPYHILLVSDFAGSDAGALSGPLNDSVVGVTADSLEEVVRTARPSVSYKTTDPLASGNVMVEVNLTFDSLKAFEPKQLVASIPAAKALSAAREKIVDRMRGQLISEALSHAVAGAIAADSSLAWLEGALKWAPAKPAPDAGAVDDVLAQLDLGDDSAEESKPPPKTPVGRLVAAAAGEGAGGIPAEEASACRRALAELDRRMSAWLTAVLHSPQVQSVEAAWRSLAYLVSRIDFRKGVRLSLLHAPAGELLERARTLLIDPVFDEGAEAPDLIVVDRQFGNTASDMETLDELAQHGASLPAIVLTGVSPQFFGVKHAWQMATLPTITNMFNQWQFAKWKALRGKPYARSLGVVFGRCLLRRPYRRDDARDLEFAYVEPCITERDLVWASGPIAPVCTIARSIA